MVGKMVTFEDLDYFFSDISRAYRNNKFSDVSFILSDGVTIETNRWMLALRSHIPSIKYPNKKCTKTSSVVVELDNHTTLQL